MTHDAYRTLAPADPEYYQALERFHATTGINAQETLLPNMWHAAILWDLPRIFFNNAGWDALDLLLGPNRHHVSDHTTPRDHADWSKP